MVGDDLLYQLEYHALFAENRKVSWVCGKAADALKAERDKSERLREALHPLIDHAKERAADAPEWSDSDVVMITVGIGDLRKAAALGKEET